MRKMNKALSVALAISMALSQVPIVASAQTITYANPTSSVETTVKEENYESEETADENGYTEVFFDDFSGDSLNSENWAVETHPAGWVNSEWQEYVDSDENIQVKDGNLYIIPRKNEEEIEVVSKPGNLLKNADFSEAGMEGWATTVAVADWGAGYSAVADITTSDGAVTFDIKNPGKDVWHVQLKQLVNLEADKTYVVSYKIKSDVDRKVLTGIQGDDRNSYKSYADANPDLVAGEEQTVTYEFTATEDFEGAAFYFSLGRAANDTSFGDESKVTISDISFSEKAEPVNMIENADFSDGLTGWANTVAVADWGPSYSAVADVSTGDGAITYSITNPGKDVWHVQLKQLVNLEAGKSYRVSYTVESSATRQILTGVQGDDRNSYKSYANSDPELTAKVPQNVEYEFSVDEDFTGAALYFSMGRAANDTETPDEAVIKISNVKMVCLNPDEEEEGESTTKTKVTYTSGRISTQNLQTFTYGKFEVRCKVPEGQGYLPAFWLMANDENIYGQWPRCGEIDCMEVMGQETDKVYGTIHYGNPHRQSQGTYVTTDENDFSEAFHTYTCEWEPGKITWYVDGVKYHEESFWYSTSVGQGTVSYPAPFDQPFYIILNLAISGSWVGEPDENTVYGEQSAFIVDYVKVYQKDEYDENVSLPEDKIDERTPDEDGNFIVNPSFDEDETLSKDDAEDYDGGWVFLTANGGEGTAEIANNEITVTTTEPGTVNYSIQLVQADIPLINGKKYRISFKAKASDQTTMDVDVKGPDAGYTMYMEETYKPELSEEWKEYTVDFDMNTYSDANGRLEFNMGGSNGAAGTIEITDVKLVKIGDADVKSDEKTVLSNGNFIYNGAFQEGDNHLGYWDIEAEDANYRVSSFSDTRRFVTDGGTVTLSQKDLAYEEGKQYAFSFDAYAKDGATVTVTIGGYDYVVEIPAGTEKNDYKLTIPAKEDFTNNDVTIKLEGAISIDNVFLAEDALIKNGSFDAGLTNYENYFADDASASWVVDSLQEDNALDVTINNTSDADYKIQVKQNNVPLEKGKTYRLTYSAKTTLEGGREIRTIMQGGESLGWPVYSEHEEDEGFNDGIVTLNDEFQTFTEEFTMTHDSDSAAFLSICMGAINGKVITDQHRVIVDNISLIEVVDEEEEEEVAPVTATYTTHVQKKGWLKEVTDGEASGTFGEALRLEAIKLSVDGNDNLGIQYTTHCQTYGWLNWSANGELNGTSGEAKRLEAIKIQLTGEDKDKYDVYYRVHAQTYGWMSWAKNGEAAGTAGEAKRLEAIQVVVVPKGEEVPDTYKGVTSKYSKAYKSATGEEPVVAGADTAHVEYKTYVQTYGLQGLKTDGAVAGTSGEAKRLESIQIELKNKDYEGGVCYNTHVQSYGWQASTTDSTKWKKDGASAGTTGLAKRLEAIQINLYGEMAEHYDIYYRVHAEKFGWMAWAKNGEISGSAGYGRRLEAVQIVIVPKGSEAPAKTYKGVTTTWGATYSVK